MPKIGLLSDTHGRAGTARNAVDRLIQSGATMLIHLGDVGATGVLDALLAYDAADQLVPAHVVFGNTDYDADQLGRYAAGLGLNVDHPMGEIALRPDQTLMFTHGDRPELVDAALGRQPAFLCRGHTHERQDTHIGPTRIINPGALYRASEYTVALLDSEANRLEFLPIRAG